MRMPPIADTIPWLMIPLSWLEMKHETDPESELKGFTLAQSVRLAGPTGSAGSFDGYCANSDAIGPDTDED